MTENLIRDEERKKLKNLFSGGFVNLDVLWGENRKALAQTWCKTLANSDDNQDSELQTLSKALRELMRQDTANTVKSGQIRTVVGGPDGN